MSYSSDRVGYGNSVTTDEDFKRVKAETQKREEQIRIRDKPSWQRTEKEKEILREYYNL